MWLCGKWAGSDLSCGQVGERQVGDGWERKPCRQLCIRRLWESRWAKWRGRRVVSILWLVGLPQRPRCGVVKCWGEVLWDWDGKMGAERPAILAGIYLLLQWSHRIYWWWRTGTTKGDNTSGWSHHLHFSASPYCTSPATSVSTYLFPSPTNTNHTASPHWRDPMDRYHKTLPWDRYIFSLSWPSRAFRLWVENWCSNCSSPIRPSRRHSVWTWETTRFPTSNYC